MQFLAQDTSITIDEAVAASEHRTGFRNVALANYMKSFGVIDNPVEYTLGVYFHHCAISMTCRQLAVAGRFLAHSGRDPSTGLSVVQAERAVLTFDESTPAAARGPLLMRAERALKSTLDEGLYVQTEERKDANRLRRL